MEFTVVLWSWDDWLVKTQIHIDHLTNEKKLVMELEIAGII